MEITGENPVIVETVPGWSHDITNIGSDELIVMLWANEIFEYLSLRKEEFPIAHKAFEKSIFDRNYYDDLCDKFRSPHLWYLNSSDEWSLRFKIENLDNNKQENDALNWEGNTKINSNFLK